MDLELDVPLPVSLQCFRVRFASTSVEISGQQSSGLAHASPPQLWQVGRGVFREVWLRTVTEMLRSQPSVSLIASTCLREQRKLCKINSRNNKSLVLLGFLFLNFVILSCKEQEDKEPGQGLCHFQHTLRMRQNSPPPAKVQERTGTRCRPLPPGSQDCLLGRSK